jgi:signal transduction histidine kinase/CheY-like chemotaxis protein
MSVARAVTALVEWFMPPDLRAADPDTFRRAKLCIAYNLAVPLWAPGFGVLLWAVGLPLIGAIVFGATLLTPLPLWVLRRTGSLVLTGNLIAAIMSLITGYCTWLEGGLGAPGVLWFPMVPILAMLIAGRWTGIAWTGTNVLVLVGFYALERSGHQAGTGIPHDAMALLHLSLSASATIVGFLLAWLFESLKADALGHLEAANRALALARDQAEAATRAKSDFLATMSHEIRTPIHGIFGMTELALDTTNDAERRDFLHRTRACAETLLAIINDILDFSRIEAGKAVLAHAEFHPEALVDGVLDTLAAQANAKGLDLLGRVEGGVPRRLRGDEGRLRQILVNLAGNAVKFTPRGAVVVRLAADEPAPDGTFVLRGVVEDTGIGIPADKQDAIFDAFTQVEGWTTSAHGGTGLGLAITRRLVTLMGGRLWLDSRRGAGSTFGFSIPLEAAAAPPVHEAIVAGTPHVLLMDASALSRAHLATLLVAHGATVTVAADPRDVRPLLVRAANRFDAVLVNVPGDCGDEDLARWLCALPPAGSPPVVALAVPRVSHADDPLARACAAVVPKPVKRATLVAVLARLLATRTAAAS